MQKLFNYYIINHNAINLLKEFVAKGELSVKKILTAITLILLIGVNCLLSACNLITINNQKYLSQTVASVDDIKISMEDLLLGYNSFGYNYVQQQSMSTEEAVKKTLETLIDRELVLKKAKEKFGDLSITKQNEVWKEVYDYVNGQVKTYADEIIKNENWNIPSQTDETKTTATKFTPYEKKVERTKNADGSYTYSRIVEKEEETDTELIKFELNEFGNEEITKKAYSKYITKIKKSRDEYSKLSNDVVFEKETKRIYDIYAKNKYLTMFQEDYENNMAVDVQKIKTKYIELVKNSAFTYKIDKSAYDKKMQSTSSGAGEVYYHPFEESKGYIGVAHILLKYSDEQSNQIKELETKLSNGSITPEQYKHELEKVANSIVVKNKQDENAPAKSVNEVFAEISNALNACGNDEDARVKTFIKYIEMYNDDDGIMSALNSYSQYYAINLDTSVTDTMIKEFADASRSFYTENKETYTIYESPVLGSYGYHIIFNMGVYKNDIPLNDIDKVTETYLFETECMKGTNKSLFDKMLELVDSSTYSEYQTSLIKDLRAGKTINYNKTAYERLYK